MKRFVAIVIVAAGLFYAVWPAYSGYSIKSALDAKDPDALRQRVDFEAVRGSMRPAITAKVENVLDDAASRAGPSGAKIYAALKLQIMPKIVEATLARAVTPDALIRVYAERGTIKEILNKIIGEQAGKPGEQAGKPGGGLAGGAAGGDGPTGFDAGKLLGGLLGGKDAPGPETKAVPASAPKSGGGLTWRNIKGFGFDGPAGVYVRLAKDAAASEADLTAHMSFQGAGWVLTGLEPKL